MKISSYLSDSERVRQRRRYRFFAMCGFGVLGLLLIGAVWLVWYSPLLEVRKVVVEGNVRVSTETVLDVAKGIVFQGNFAKFLGINRMFAWPEFARENITLLPAVASLTISKSYATRTVRVQVTERVPVGVWCLFPARNYADGTQTDAEGGSVAADATPRDSAPGGCWWFDKSGVLFARALDGEGGLLKTVHDYSGRTLGIGSVALPSHLMGNLLEIFLVLRESGAVAGEVRLEDLSREEVEVVTLNGPRLYFSLRFPLAAIADAVRQIFSESGQFPHPQKLQYVDFRVENRVYYK
ncbi:MAG: FtsQ-type POTRA domain-containing protein [Candidatus Liptonbacteria bacterium]|nr:FtsQ-type POTRA domain-containing protein [Candidatus Liptonbacteria bacterium]